MVQSLEITHIILRTVPSGNSLYIRTVAAIDGIRSIRSSHSSTPTVCSARKTGRIRFRPRNGNFGT